MKIDPCDPNRYALDDPRIAPAVLITWGTENLADHPGETFDAGSGYFLDAEHVVTAKHVGDMIRNDVNHRDGALEVIYAMDVHDPRAKLSWRVTHEKSLKDSDISLLKVVPHLFKSSDQAAHDQWRASFIRPPHRARPVSAGETIQILGYSPIHGKLV